MCRELRVAGAQVPPKVLIAVSGLAAQSNTGVTWPYIRDLLLFIDQVRSLSVTCLTLRTLACAAHLDCILLCQRNEHFAPWISATTRSMLMQAYCQQAQNDLEEALAQQHREVQKLTRKLVNAEPAAWVLQRQRVAHLERQLRTCTCRARRRLAERSGRDVLHFSVDKAFYLSREIDRCECSHLLRMTCLCFSTLAGYPCMRRVVAAICVWINSAIASLDI